MLYRRVIISFHWNICTIFVTAGEATLHMIVFQSDSSFDFVPESANEGLHVLKTILLAGLHKTGKCSVDHVNGLPSLKGEVHARKLCHLQRWPVVLCCLVLDSAFRVFSPLSFLVKLNRSLVRVPLGAVRLDRYENSNHTQVQTELGSGLGPVPNKLYHG